MSWSESTKRITIIPVYHDRDSIRTVLKKFPSDVVDEICLVADCATAEESKEIGEASERTPTPVHTIFNKERNGIGAAIRQGVEYALNNGYNIAVIMAGNNKDDPGEISRLLEPIEKEGCDYVQGSRFLPGGRRVKNPLMRGVFSRVYPFVWTLLTGVRCTDVTNGFRAYRLEIFDDRRVNIWQDWLDNYELEYYVHYKVLTLGYKVKEVPVSKVYPYRHKGGYSKIAPFRDWWKIVGPLIYLTLGAKK